MIGMTELELLCGDKLTTGNMVIKQPTIREIKQFGEREYFTLVQALTFRPYDDKVRLDDMGIDYEEMSEFEYFVFTHKSLAGFQEEYDISLLIEGVNFGKLELEKNIENGELALRDELTGVVIDRLIHGEITDFIRTTHHMPKKPEFNPGNKATKKDLIDRERRKQKREKNGKNGKKFESHLAPVISSLVWDSGSAGDYAHIWDLTLYQLMDGLWRKRKIKEYTGVISGIYAGTVDRSKVNMDELIWHGKNEF